MLLSLSAFLPQDGIRVLTNFCRMRENQDVAVAAGGIACAVRLINLKASSLSARSIRCFACQLLDQLCTQEVHSRKAFADGVIDTVLAFLQHHASDTQEMARAGNEQPPTLALTPALHASPRARPPASFPQEKAFEMICSVTNTKAARLAAVDGGILRHILHGQQIHGSDPHIQQSAAEALAAISADAACGAKAVQSGAMESVLFHGLKAFPNEARIQMAREPTGRHKQTQ